MLQVLSARDGRSAIDGATVDHFQGVRASFEDELAGIEDFKLIRSSLFNLFLRCNDGSASTLPVSRNYFDNTNTKEIETVEEIFLKTLSETAGALKGKFKNEGPAS